MSTLTVTHRGFTSASLLDAKDLLQMPAFQIGSVVVDLIANCEKLSEQHERSKKGCGE